MNRFLFGLAEITLAGSVIIALLLLGGRAWGKRFAPKWRYLAWLVVALRLAVPFNLSLPKAPVIVRVPTVITAVQPMMVAPGAPAPNVTPGTPNGPRLSPLDMLLGLWAVGGCGFLAVQLWGYAALRHRVKRWGRGGGEYEGLPVVECPGLPSPMLMGFLRPAIVLPEGLEGETRDFALLHEATHHRRHDLWYKLLLVWCNAVHWFNPLVWVMRRRAAEEIERACDAGVLGDRDEDYRRSYGGALLRQVTVGRQSGGALTSAFSGSGKSLRQRITALMDMAPKHSGRAALAAVCVLALLGGSMVACRGALTYDSGKAETRYVAIYDLSGGDDLFATAQQISFLDMEHYDPARGIGYYCGYEPGQADPLTTLPVAENAPYTGFPVTMGQSEPMHPSKVMRFGMLASSLAWPAIPAVLTVRDGVIEDLSPLGGCVRIPLGSQGKVVDGKVHYYINGAKAVIHRVDTQTHMVHGYWMNEDGAMDYDRPFSLLCQEKDIVVTMRSGPLNLEGLEQYMGLLSSWGIPMEVNMTDGEVSGLTQVDAAGVQIDNAWAEGRFLNFKSHNPGDGRLDATWEEFSGSYYGYSFSLREARAVTVECTMSDNVALSLVFPDGTEQALNAGSNDVALPEGVTQMVLTAATGGSGSFTLLLSSAEGISVNG